MVSKWLGMEHLIQGGENVNDHVSNLLMGRSMLIRASNHLASHSRVRGLTCSLRDEELDHIGEWKTAGKEYGFGECDDQHCEMLECPRCSAQYAAFKAKRIVRARVGRINGMLTRIGNRLREASDGTL